jgi:hypothetical protein
MDLVGGEHLGRESATGVGRWLAGAVAGHRGGGAVTHLAQIVLSILLLSLWVTSDSTYHTTAGDRGK